MPSCSNASTTSFDSSPNRNVEFELSHDQGVQNDVTTTAVVITVGESGALAGEEGAVRVPIRTKKGFIFIEFHFTYENVGIILVAS